MEEQTNHILDLSNKKLKKLNKYSSHDIQEITVLILDDNCLQRLDNIDVFTKLQKLSIVRNQLLRMYGVCRLHSLHTLNLAHNGILTIEGLKELVNLKWLCLAGNSIKTIEHLNTNINLEFLDLSENNITHISDLSYLKNLKELYLHNNKINHLRQCERFLPISLITLTLANNNIEDLNEISQLVHLVNLANISIKNNPCVIMGNDNNTISFDYRPFVINWCVNIKTIDGYLVDALESLRAEWLYSQGRGRHFRVGDQKELVQYLSSVCPLTGEKLETEEDRKLRLILSKAQHHQQQLREQSYESPMPSPSLKKKLQTAKHSPRSASRISKIKSPDRMTSSCYNPGNMLDNSTIMSQSLDPTILRQTITNTKIANDNTTTTTTIITDKCLDEEPVNSPLQALSKMVPVPESLMSPDYRPAPSIVIGKVLNKIETTSIPPPQSPRIVRLPKNKTKVDTVIIDNNNSNRKSNSPSPARSRHNKTITNNKINRKKSPKSSDNDDDDDESEVCPANLQMIQMKVEKKRLQKDNNTTTTTTTTKDNNNDDKIVKAAICIQKMWRGYFTRNRNKEVQEMFRTLQLQRAGTYIQQLSNDMETTKAALESERKIQMLQTEAISALWKQMSALNNCGQQSTVSMTSLSGDNVEIVKELARTCTSLQNQIQQLQNSMQDIMKVITVFSRTNLNNSKIEENGIGTQTEIVAVHTPQGEAGKVFPFQKQTTRPSSLPLPINQQRKKDITTQQQQTNQTELRQFADNLVDDVIKIVSETRADCLNLNTTEITITDTTKKLDDIAEN